MFLDLSTSRKDKHNLYLTGSKGQIRNKVVPIRGYSEQLKITESRERF